MTRERTGSNSPGARAISVQIYLEGGHCHEVTLGEDSAELASLFHELAGGGSGRDELTPHFIQLPADQGRAAISFRSTQLVSVITRPPVVIRFEPVESPLSAAREAAQTGSSVVVTTPRRVIIDDFLAPDEHNDMLAYALANEAHFKAGTVTSSDAHYRQNLVIMDFHEAAHSRLLCNRLLTWFPQIVQMLGMEVFAVESVESQLTASNDGHYFRPHADRGDDATAPRALSCVYYFFKRPRAFAGGALRLYDTRRQGEQLHSADSYQEIEPVSNRLVVFPSDSHHELTRIRCPSRKFGDSRFAITNWLRRADTPDPEATFGWGHLHCRLVPSGFEVEGERRT